MRYLFFLKLVKAVAFAYSTFLFKEVVVDTVAILPTQYFQSIPTYISVFVLALYLYLILLYAIAVQIYSQP